VRDLARARMLALPAPATPDDARALLEALERQPCRDARLLARAWRAAGGEAEFDARTLEAARRYLASPDRSTGKRASEDFAAQVKAWAGTVKAKPAKAAWAERLLKEFEGREMLEIRGKRSLDPAAAELFRLAGRVPPAAA
ncbi:MAG: hypothetical protein ACKOYN_07670, partial [Planctomycetota bacterium]